MIVRKRKDKVIIDLTGPAGNAYALIGTAIDLGKQINKLLGEEKYNLKAIEEDMKSSDYEHLVQVMEDNFGPYIILYR